MFFTRAGCADGWVFGKDGVENMVIAYILLGFEGTRDSQAIRAIAQSLTDTGFELGAGEDFVDGNQVYRLQSRRFAQQHLENYIQHGLQNCALEIHLNPYQGLKRWNQFVIFSCCSA